MTQEDKQLLLTDLIPRLHWGVKVYHAGSAYNKRGNTVGGYYAYESTQFYLTELEYWTSVEQIKPYLRKLSSMTEEEKQYYQNFFNYDGVEYPEEYIDWLNEHHFDYRGLIEKGLALEAPEGMYET